MNYIKFFFIKIAVLIKIYKNYNRLSKNDNYNVKIDSFYKLLYYLTIDQFLFKLFFNFKKKIILSLIENKSLIFSIRSVNISEKNFIANNVKKFNFSIKTSCSNELAQLKNNGYLNLGKIFSKLDCNKFINFLENKKFYNSQQPLQSDGKEYIFSKKKLEINNFPYCAFLPDQFFEFVKFKNLLKSKKISDLINSYLNFNANIYSALTWVNIPSKNKHYVHNLHRDYDDFKFLVLIINWTTVTKNNGATRFIKKSHLSDYVLNKNIENTVYLEGDQGSIYLADTFALHSGTPLKEGIKVSSWIRYGKLINAASIQDGFVTTP
jgi:hypothetical protein